MNCGPFFWGVFIYICRYDKKGVIYNFFDALCTGVFSEKID